MPVPLTLWLGRRVGDLLYLGLPVLMKAPEDRAVAYTILVILAALVLFLVIGLVAGSFMAGPMM